VRRFGAVVETNGQVLVHTFGSAQQGVRITVADIPVICEALRQQGFLVEGVTHYVTAYDESGVLRLYNLVTGLPVMP
jgi:hypothetical protein